LAVPGSRLPGGRQALPGVPPGGRFGNWRANMQRVFNSVSGKNR